MKLSASQIETAQSCMRKWYLNKVAKCPQPFDRNKLLGEVGHEVLERFRTNRPLYPDGWTSPTNRFTGEKSEHHITTTEQALVKVLVTKSIQEGVIIIEPDGQVEREFGLTLSEEIEGETVQFVGFIDYQYGNVIEDHKFIGPASTKYYSIDKLSKALAMNFYAYAGYREGFITDPTVWLRYNLFVKDTTSPQVSIKHVEKSKEEIFNFYEDKIKPIFKPMVLSARNCSSWEQVDNAMCRGKAETVCKKYGGCEYLDICLGKITVEQYRERLTTNKEDSMAGFLSNMKKGAAAPAVAEVKEEVKENPALVAAPVVERKKAPWAFMGCPMCKVSGTPIWGMNKKNEPCNICKMSSNAEKESGIDRPVLEDYDITVHEDGKVTWKEIKTQKAVVEVKPVTKEPVVKEALSTKGGDTFPAADLVDDPKPAEELVMAPDAPEGFTVNKEAYNPERTGRFILSYATVQNRAQRVSKKLGDPSCVVHISEVVELIAPELLAVANKRGAAAETFLDVDYYLRRDLISRNAKVIAESLGSSIVDASNVMEASMEHAVCASVERYASMVIGNRK